MARNNWGDSYNHQYERQELVNQYEQMLKNEQNYFFEQGSFVNIIEHYEDQLEFIKALEVTEYALAQHPYSATFLIKKSQLLFEAKNCFEALELLEQAEALSPTDIEIFLLRAEIYTYTDKFDDALDLLYYSLNFADKEEKADVYLAIAEVFEGLEKEEKAYKYIKKTLRYKPTHEDALNKVDYYIDTLEKYEESIEIHKWVIDKDPYCYLAWYNLGNAHFGLEQYEKAIDAYGFATAINEKYDLAYQDCGDAYYELGQYDKSLEEYLEALKLGDPNEELFYSIGMCFYHANNYEQAIEYFEKALQLDDEHQETYYQLGISYRDLFQKDIAMQFFKKAIYIEPNNEEYLKAIGELFALDGEPEKVIPYYQEGIKHDEENAALWVDLTILYLNLGAVEDALLIIETALEELKETPELLYTHAACLFILGEHQEAMLQLTEALVMDYNKHDLLFKILPVLANDIAIKELIVSYVENEALDK